MAQATGKIIIQKPYLGWIPTLETSDSHALESTLGITAETLIAYPPQLEQDYTSSISIMANRPGYEGHIAPGPVFDNITDNGGGNPTVNGLAINAVTAPDGNCYVLLDSNRYVLLNLATQTIGSGNYASGIGSTAGIHGSHTNFVTTLGDICIYPTVANGGANTQYNTYATWTDNTDGDIAQLSGNSVVASNYYTNLGGTALFYGMPHPILATMNINKNVYFGNGSYLGMFNPVSNAFADQALVLPTGWIINGLTTYQDFIAIIAYKVNNFSETPLQGSQTKLYLWNGTDPVPSFQYDLQDNFVSNVFFDGANLYAITYGRNDTIKLKRFNGQGFDILYETGIAGGFPGGSTSPNPCFGGMDLWLNHVVWSNNSTGSINAYGSSAESYPPGFHSWALANSTNGMCKNLYSNLLFIGNKSGSSYTIKYSDFSKYDNQAQFNSCLYPLPTNSTITYVKLYPSSWPSSSSEVEVAIIKDYNSRGFGSGGDLLNWTATGGTNAYYIQKSQTIDNVNSFSLLLGWGASSTSNAPIIRKVEIGYSFDDNNI